MIRVLIKINITLLFILSCILAQAQNDLSVSFKPTSDSIKMGDTLVFEVLTKHESGATLAGGTQLQFNFQIGVLGSFNFNHVLSQSLQAGDSIVFNTPPFVLQQSGNLPFCLTLVLNSDTALENNTFCDTLWVEHPVSIFEHERNSKSIFIRQNTIENRSGELQSITLYNLQGQFVEHFFLQSNEKRQLQSLSKFQILIFTAIAKNSNTIESGKILAY
jgi:hypothetical protein